jgi:hypothetical protein
MKPTVNAGLATPQLSRTELNTARSRAAKRTIALLAQGQRHDGASGSSQALSTKLIQPRFRSCTAEIFKRHCGILRSAGVQ